MNEAVEVKNIPGLTEGRIVKYVIRPNLERPAIIVQVWDKITGMSNLIVFRDTNNDAQSSNDMDNTMWVGSASYSEGKEPGTWHYIEKA